MTRIAQDSAHRPLPACRNLHLCGITLRLTRRATRRARRPSFSQQRGRLPPLTAPGATADRVFHPRAPHRAGRSPRPRRGPARHPCRGAPRDDHRHRRQDGRPSRLVARRRGADARPPPAPRIAARPDRLGHGPPGLRPQAPDRPPRPLRDPPPDRRHRRLPAALGERARRLRRRPRRDRPLDRPGAGHGPGPPPRPRADRRRRRRRGAHERPVARGAQRHRPSEDPAPDRPERQRDVDQPDRRCVLDLPVEAQAQHTVAADEDGLRQPRRKDPGRRRRRPRVEPAAPALRRQPRRTGTAVRGSRDHLRRGLPGSRPPRPPRGIRAGARAQGPGARPRSDPEGPRLPTRRDRPGLVPRRGAPADGPRPRCRCPRSGQGPRSSRIDAARGGLERRRGAAGDEARRPEEAPQLHLGLRRRARDAGRRRSSDRRHHRGHADRDGHGEVRGRLPGAGDRRRHRRAARDDDGRRPGPRWHAPGRRDLLDVPAAGLRPDGPRRLPERPAGRDRRRPGGARRRGRDLAPGDVHDPGPAPAAVPRDRLAEGRAGAAGAGPYRHRTRIIPSRSTTRAIPGSGFRPSIPR